MIHSPPVVFVLMPWAFRQKQGHPALPIGLPDANGGPKKLKVVRNMHSIRVRAKEEFGHLSIPTQVEMA
jgi:hypothetical protein